MQNKRTSGWIRLLSGVFILLLTVGGIRVCAWENAVDSAQAVIDSILSYMCAREGADDVQDLLDTGSLSEWMVLGLARLEPSLDFQGYDRFLVEKWEEADALPPASRLKFALIRLAIGAENPEAYTSLVEETAEEGILCTAFALHLVNNGVPSKTKDAAWLTERLLAAQNADGGWSVFGEHSDCDVTAMVLQALAPRLMADTAEDNKALQTAVDTALAWLQSVQLPDGGFVSYGAENPESGAQVMTALAMLGRNPLSDPSFTNTNGAKAVSVADAVKTFARTDGSFSHVRDGDANETATVQVFYAFVAARLWEKAAAGEIVPSAAKLYVFPPKTTGEKDSGGESVPAETETQALPLPDSHVQPSPSQRLTKYGYKPVVCAAIVLLGGAACLLLAILRRGNGKTYLFIGMLVAAGIVFVLVTRWESASSYYRETEEAERATPPIGEVTLTILCDTVAAEAQVQNGTQAQDGVFLRETAYPLYAGETVFDLLTRAAREERLLLAHNGTGYIRGIGGLYELDFGELSGWMYFVNGEAPSVGCDSYILEDGDAVVWRYTRSLGEDLTEPAVTVTETEAAA